MNKTLTRLLAAAAALLLCLTLISAPALAAADGAEPLQPALPGDVDGSGERDVHDAVLLLKLLLTGGALPDGADVNDDGFIDIWDVISILRLTVGGEAAVPASGSDAEDPSPVPTATPAPADSPGSPGDAGS